MVLGVLVVLLEAGSLLRSPESVVHANQNSALGRFDAAAGQTGNSAEYGVARAEVHVITFQKCRPVRREHPFNATTDRPA